MKPGNTEAKTRRKREAVKGVVFFALVQMATAVCFGALSLIPDIPGWLGTMFLILGVVCILLLIPALMVLKQRFAEIEGGELDEAGQY